MFWGLGVCGILGSRGSEVRGSGFRDFMAYGFGAPGTSCMGGFMSEVSLIRG